MLFLWLTPKNHGQIESLSCSLIRPLSNKDLLPCGTLQVVALYIQICSEKFQLIDAAQIDRNCVVGPFMAPQLSSSDYIRPLQYKFFVDLWRSHANFINVHYAYILTIVLLAFILLSTGQELSSIDSFFFAVSSATGCGLSVADLSTLNTYTQTVLCTIPFLTNFNVISIAMVAVRWHFFGEELNKTAARMPAIQNNQSSEAAKVSRSRIGVGRYGTDDTLSGHHTACASIGRPATSLQMDTGNPYRRAQSPVWSAKSWSIASIGRLLVKALASVFVLEQPTDRLLPNLDNVRQPEEIRLTHSPRSSDGLGRLCSRDKKLLGGPEYAALGLLLKLLVAHFVILHLVGIMFLVPWITYSPGPYPKYLADQAINKLWWGFQSAATMVNNVGLTLTPDSMFSFRDAPWPMVAMSILALMGNTFFPVCLRFWIWILTKVTPASCSLQEPLSYLLKHPRRCFTLLFPRRPTWILFVLLLSLNILDMLLIVAFHLKLSGVGLSTLRPGQRFCAILFQAASIRTTGTTALNITAMHPAAHLGIVIMMYFAPLPVAIGMRHTVELQYEERELCLIDDDEADTHNNPGGRTGFGVKRHLQNQLTFDLWFMAAGMFAIACVEQKAITDDPAFSMFAILFEVVSAYGNVGLSLGHPSVSYSLSGRFKLLSKLIICALMIRGRHRMLPSKIDRTIQLPRDQVVGEAVAAKVEGRVLSEAREHSRGWQGRNTTVTAAGSEEESRKALA